MAALITIDQFKNEYNISRSTVYRLRDRGEIRFVHIGRSVRIRREDVESWYQSLLGEPAND